MNIKAINLVGERIASVTDPKLRATLWDLATEVYALGAQYGSEAVAQIAEFDRKATGTSTGAGGHVYVQPSSEAGSIEEQVRAGLAEKTRRGGV